MKTNITERGELFDFFLSVLNHDRKKNGYKPYDHARLGYMLTKIPTADLYALKSKMEDAQRRGSRFSTPGVVFHKEISARRPEPGITLK